MRSRILWVVVLVGACAGSGTSAPVEPVEPVVPASAEQAAATRATPPPAPVEAESVKPGINERFLDPTLDVDEWTKRFEGESREIAAARDAIVAALAIEPGDAVADVGAGTGLFLRPFHAAVGDTGKVYAVDISPRFLDHLRARVDDEELARAAVVTGTERSVELPADSVDLVFVCDTYHHFEYPQSTLASIHRALRPGGALVVIDFERIPGETEEWILGHVRAGKATFRAEIEQAGFTFDREIDLDGIEENYVLRFIRP